jgi:gamma-glutamyltranspeptidase / glutathione hydrolase / leukotriene-C4 hydrolase
MLGNPDWSAIFAPRGRFLREGEIIRRKNYSRTLAAIASHGPDAFYTVRNVILCSYRA